MQVHEAASHVCASRFFPPFVRDSILGEELLGIPKGSIADDSFLSSNIILLPGVSRYSNSDCSTACTPAFFNTSDFIHLKSQVQAFPSAGALQIIRYTGDPLAASKTIELLRPVNSNTTYACLPYLEEAY